jgi:hypothetical protein
MKAALIRDNLRIAELLIVNVEIEVTHILRPVIGQGDTRSSSIWHVKVAVHGAILHCDRQGPPGLVFLARLLGVLEAGPKEIAYRHLDAGICFAVPVHPQHQLAQMERTRRVDGEPNVPDGAGALDICECGGRPGLQWNPVRIATGTVRA